MNSLLVMEEKSLNVYFVNENYGKNTTGEYRLFSRVCSFILYGGICLSGY